ncbi:hypothetical protein ACUY4R_002450 [Kosakonia sp. BK9b]
MFTAPLFCGALLIFCPNAPAVYYFLQSLPLCLMLSSFAVPERFAIQR